MRRKPRIGRRTPAATKKRLNREKKKVPEQVQKIPEISKKPKRNKAAAPSDQKSSKCNINNVTTKKLRVKLKRMEIKCAQKNIITSMKKKSANWQESFVLSLGITGSGRNLQPIVKHEPILEADEFEKKIANPQDSIELTNEVKIEYDCVTNGDAISTITPILINEPENESNLNLNDDQADIDFSPISLSSLEILSLGTKFSKMPPIKSKDEALRIIRLLETFALCKENFRLIGFIERLQNHFERIS